MASSNGVSPQCIYTVRPTQINYKSIWDANKTVENDAALASAEDLAMKNLEHADESFLGQKPSSSSVRKKNPLIMFLALLLFCNYLES